MNKSLAQVKAPEILERETGETLAHEFGHVHQFRVAGSEDAVRLRRASEMKQFGRQGQYYRGPAVPRDAQGRVDLSQLDPLDPNYTIEGIAETVEAGARDYYP